MVITFFVPGKPQGKARARSTRSGHHYTPKKTVDYEQSIRAEAVAAMYRTLAPMATGRVDLRIEATFAIPKSWPKKKQQDALDGLLVPGKPDWDNIGKVISDALNGVAYIDDAQVSSAFVIKKYGHREGVAVVVASRD